MPTKPSAIFLTILAVLCGLAIWGSFRLDAPVRQAVVEQQGKGWKKTTDYKFHSNVRKFGDWPPVLLAAIAGLGLARWRNNRRWMHILFAAILSAAIAGLVAHASKLTTGRTRPRESPKTAQGFYGLWKDGNSTVGNAALNSFPSGHTATVFGLAAVIVLAAPAWGAAALALAGIVAWSSIAMGAHHPSDVVVSIVLSFAVAWPVWRWMQGNGGRLADRLLRVQTLPEPL